MKIMKMWAVISCKTYKDDFGKWIEVDWRRDSDWMCFREANNLLCKLLVKETDRAYALDSEDREVSDNTCEGEEKLVKEWMEKSESLLKEMIEVGQELVALTKSEITEENIVNYLKEYRRVMNKLKSNTDKSEKLNRDYGIDY